MLLKNDKVHFKPTSRMTKTLTRRYDGPYKVLACFGKVVYRLELLKLVHLLSMFHVSRFGPLVIEVDEPGRTLLACPLAGVIDKSGKIIAECKGMQKVGWGNPSRIDYLISWEGSTCLDDTWECVKCFFEAFMDPWCRRMVSSYDR